MVLGRASWQSEKKWKQMNFADDLLSFLQWLSVRPQTVAYLSYPATLLPALGSFDLLYVYEFWCCAVTKLAISHRFIIICKNIPFKFIFSPRHFGTARKVRRNGSSFLCRSSRMCGILFFNAFLWSPREREMQMQWSVEENCILMS